MENKKLVRIVLVMGICVMLLLCTTGISLAANNTNFAELDLNSMSSTNNTTSNNTAATTNNTVRNSTTNTSNTANVTNTTNNTAVLTTNNTANASNTTTYNATSLPKTGIGDSMPAIILTIVFGISAIYAYKKIQDYRGL